MGGLADLPLWSRARPDWAISWWEQLKTELSMEEGWDVWIEWYADRLRGGSGGEAYELVFVSTPIELWDRSPAAAHVWIREHLPKHLGGSKPPDFPPPLPGPV